MKLQIALALVSVLIASCSANAQPAMNWNDSPNNFQNSLNNFDNSPNNFNNSPNNFNNSPNNFSATNRV